MSHPGRQYGCFVNSSDLSFCQSLIACNGVLRNFRTTTSKSSSDLPKVLRRATPTASRARVRGDCKRCGVWLRSCTLSRCFHLYSGCSVAQYRTSKPTLVRHWPRPPPAPSARCSSLVMMDQHGRTPSRMPLKMILPRKTQIAERLCHHPG